MLASDQRTRVHAALNARRTPGVGWCHPGGPPGDGGTRRKRVIEEQEGTEAALGPTPPFGEENQVPPGGTDVAEASGELVAGPGLERDRLLWLLQGRLQATE